MQNRIFRKYNDTPDLEGLQEFSQSRDRDYARFFVGRKDELKDINTAWQLRMKQWGPGNTDVFSSSTRVVQGAPGAGKTSVGNRLAKELWNPEHPDYMFGKIGNKAPHVVRLSAKTLNNTLNVFRNICEVIKPDVQGMFETTRTKSIGQAGSAAAVVVKGELTRQTTDQFKQAAADMEWSHLRQALGKYRWTRPVCLLIDEAQNLDEAGIEFLATIHQGTHHLPVFPLLLGLGNTWETLISNEKLTRLESGAVHTLGALTKEEVEDLCNRYFATFRIEGTSARKNEFATGLHAWSEGWPSHMHNALKGLTRELLQANGDLTVVSCKKSLAHAQTYRDLYYTSRKGNIFNRSPAFLGVFMAGLDAEKKFSEDRIDGLIAQAQKMADDLGDRRIGTHSVDELFNRLLARGFIQPDSSGDYVCTIPSLRRWCLDRAGMEDPLEGNPAPAGKKPTDPPTTGQPPQTKPGM